MGCRSVWLVAAAVTATVGAWVAVVGWTAMGVFLTFLPTATLGVCITAYLLPEDDETRVGRLTRAGAATGTAAVAAGGIADLLGVQAATILVVVLALTSPPAVRWLQQRLDGPVEGTAPRQDAQQGGTSPRAALPGATEGREPRVPRAMSDLELCEAWSSSYALLQATPHPEEQARIVLVRHAYLDELERRNPAGLRRWLSAGARAASNPARYLVQHRPQHRPD